MATILYIDDDKEYGALLGTLLDTYGFAVETAWNGLDGVKKAHELQPDLILLDLYLPPDGGSVVVRQLKEQSPTRHIPVVMMSALPIDRSRQMLQGAEIQGFISKPFRIEQLLHLIRINLSPGEGRPPRQEPSSSASLP